MEIRFIKTYLIGPNIHFISMITGLPVVWLEHTRRPRGSDFCWRTWSCGCSCPTTDTGLGPPSLWPILFCWYWFGCQAAVFYYEKDDHPGGSNKIIYDRQYCVDHSKNPHEDFVTREHRLDFLLEIWLPSFVYLTCNECLILVFGTRHVLLKFADHILENPNFTLYWGGGAVEYASQQFFVVVCVPKIKFRIYEFSENLLDMFKFGLFMYGALGDLDYGVCSGSWGDFIVRPRLPHIRLHDALAWQRFVPQAGRSFPPKMACFAPLHRFLPYFAKLRFKWVYLYLDFYLFFLTYK